ncbi:pentapeptide repeat-containing protein [Sphingobacterium sp.]|uniref:pentapeptide repeat-containing protein n=1 Tax=Sphingobacterium sp. TaxID=341027 RepID=UPI0031E2F339
MKSNGRERFEDQIIDSNLENENFHNKLFIRVGAKGRIFKNVDFSHTYFDNCYFRNIQFDSCVFQGCKFNNCNFQSSSFSGSNFEYSTFEKTFIDSDILNNNCPSHNNLKLKFVRSLRLNFQSLGDSVAVNKAIKIELSATKEYYYEAWHSNTSYYRKKYTNWKRIDFFFKWLNFRIQDYVWGNGESIYKLIRTGLFLWIIFSVLETLMYKNSNSLFEYWKSFLEAPSVFMGIYKPIYYEIWYYTLITVLRFIGFALFTSILIKRYNRR